MKSPEYYSHARDDIVDLVMSTGSVERILDVGCGYGYTGELLKNMGAIRVEGLEFVPDACEEAKHRLDQIFQGSAEDSSLISTLGSYDCIICADLLEHLIDPWETLTLLRNHLNKNGRLVCSIPNIRYFKIISKLLFFGEWTYKDSGILDKTHYRFFTRKTIELMFKQTGFTAIITKQKTRRVTALFNFITLGLFGDFFPMKFYVIAHPTDVNRNN
ncbi:MAG: class I SAM-dependent methyltransferase [Candidatus Marinimicrobia bacterium]|nr:class I SAM-dependent methyltransferase [Candidatus Neomarinimicrobiota bacterium]